MKLIRSSCLLVSAWLLAGLAHASCPDLLKHDFNRLQDEQPQSLCQYSGKVILVVNTASYCGYTSQYDGLEKIYNQYKSSGLVVLGFPSNDFGSQEPGNNKQIAEFCKNTFDVKFPMFSKTAVSGPKANPMFQMLAQQTGGAPRWNFHKYLIGRDGKAVAQYNSSVEPTDIRITNDIKTALARQIKENQ